MVLDILYLLKCNINNFYNKFISKLMEEKFNWEKTLKRTGYIPII